MESLVDAMESELNVASAAAVRVQAAARGNTGRRRSKEMLAALGKPKSKLQTMLQRAKALKAEPEIESPHFALSFEASKASVNKVLDTAFAKLLDVRVE